MTFFRCQIDNSGDTKSLDDDRMTPLAHAMERGAGKSAEFLLNHGTLLTTYSLLSRDYNKAYNLLLMYILNFEPVIKRTGFFFHNSATTRDGWRLFIWGWYWWQQSPSSGCEQWCTCGKHAPFRPLSCREVDWFKRSSLCSKIPQSEILGF